jgi:hypothetical protein
MYFCKCKNLENGQQLEMEAKVILNASTLEIDHKWIFNWTHYYPLVIVTTFISALPSVST